MSYRLALVDDEPLARGRLARLLKEHLDFELVVELESGDATLQWLEHHRADVLLLDIQMPGRSGLETAQALQQYDTPPLVVFCTAFDEHALDAFGVSAIDYLLKPVRPADLQRALERVRERLEARELASRDLSEEKPEHDEGTAKIRTHLTARTHMGLQRIPLEDICYFLADQKYVNAIQEQGETLIDDSLRQLEEEFGDRFVRVHRSALVARDRIVRLEAQEGRGHVVYLNGIKDGVAVSRRHLPDVRKVMKSF
ncbi:MULTISPECIES: LytTR family DNA-binding domain-containing protein [unclassified Oceanobacter]|uniref:LytR/AlgR family response regulator transcription factor n=1 Tax=unclassified Oceanobacter TaxID=2620260 RepID=UPI002732724A|nr:MULTISPECIES: LytTR family DNA-binding domain-containing protein [unclassified Oceanobacter]MDP2504589.1 LytTR family DNA-binding domain-containing protein [Oceanobacter sp. 3_MG-2023]MDP2546958.1 LytTR family DNA-binding domain-containing protein [Oceanobacter sp. 4_MG-2023]MDP2607782.1 LytTR family DNA-binding domain-containing protein [Oceanobacter sp. 1_MG-2023]MDP2611034.1 LytTR family DNA-binding domain-containing protein [Oceanobacter sp. 2_MG-2023]